MPGAASAAFSLCVSLFSKVLNDFLQPIADGELLRAFLLALAALLALGCEFGLSREHTAQDYIVVKFGNLRSIKHTGCIVQFKAFGDTDAGGTGHTILAAGISGYGLGGYRDGSSRSIPLRVPDEGSSCGTWAGERAPVRS